MVRSGINPEVTVTMMRIVVIVPDTGRKYGLKRCNMPTVDDSKRSKLPLNWLFRVATKTLYLFQTALDEKHWYFDDFYIVLSGINKGFRWQYHRDFWSWSWRCHQAQIRGLSVKRHGAVWNKLMSFHSNMSDFRHKNMDYRGEIMVSSGIKEGTPVTMKCCKTHG